MNEKIKKLLKKHPELKKFYKLRISRDICNYLQHFVNDEDVLVVALVQNPFGATKKLEIFKKTYGERIYNVLKTLNDFHDSKNYLFEKHDEFEGIIILFLINYKFIFDYQKRYRKARDMINREKINYVMKLLMKNYISELRTDLEDKLFSYLEPKIYDHYLSLLEFTKETHKNREHEVKEKFSHLLREAKIPAQIESRLKSIHSIHHKIVKENILYSQILDTIGLRFITDNEKNCYKIMNLALKNWPILTNRIKDYIAIPKPNGYRSIHMTIIHDGYPVELQIRTEEMHQEAQYGRASHEEYKNF